MIQLELGLFGFFIIIFLKINTTSGITGKEKLLKQELLKSITCLFRIILVLSYK